MNGPLVTVLMPVYNAEKYLNEAIDSILNQTLTDFQLLIINDGSTDSSAKLIASYSDKRIRTVHNEQNLGLIATLNKGIDLVDTKYMARMDADDVSMPERLRTQLDFMETHSEIGACGTWFDHLRADGSVKTGGRYHAHHDEIRLRQLYLMHFIHGTAMIRMELLKQRQLKFDPNFPHAEDYDLFDRLGNVSKLANIQRSLYQIRVHPESVSRLYAEVQKKNSDRVKARIFENLGLEVGLSELDLFASFMYQNYHELKGEKTVRLMDLIDRMIAADRQSSYFKKAFLRKELALRFLHMCHGLASHNENVFPLLNGFAHKRFLDDPKLYVATYLRSTLSFLRR